MICKRCGTRYTISGLHNVNRTQYLIILARRAKETENYSRAIKYYEQYLLEDPYSWEAEYNIKLCAFLGAGPGKRPNRLGDLAESFDTITKLISRIDDPEERKRAIFSINDEIIEISKDNYLNADMLEVFNGKLDETDDVLASIGNSKYLQGCATLSVLKWSQGLATHIYENDHIYEAEDI